MYSMSIICSTYLDYLYVVDVCMCVRCVWGGRKKCRK